MNYSGEIFGGLLIGFASALPLLFEGRIAGVSGYASSLLRPNTVDGKSGFFFVLGLIFAGFLWRNYSTVPLPYLSAEKSDLILWGIGGLLVGFGSRLGGGCTSGHGVCGLGRASPRSFASVIIFMSVAVATTVLTRYFS